MSWGYKITILTLGFVCFMTGLVIAAFHQDFDLVTEDYYGKELKFQSQMEKQRHHEQLHETITCKQNGDSISLLFPKDFEDENIEGSIVFFRPSDAAKDVQVKLMPHGRKQSIDKKKLSKGLYQIQIDYSVNGRAYYFEENIQID